MARILPLTAVVSTMTTPGFNPFAIDTDYTAAGSGRRLARFVHGDHEFFGAATEKARPKPGFGLKLAS